MNFDDFIVWNMSLVMRKPILSSALSDQAKPDFSAEEALQNHNHLKCHYMNYQ